MVEQLTKVITNENFWAGLGVVITAVLGTSIIIKNKKNVTTNNIKGNFKNSSKINITQSGGNISGKARK